MHPALGIDYGEARIGIAATDACGILAHPVESIHLQRTEPLERIATLVAERGIRTLVLGLPLRMDGTEGTACAKVRAFGEKLPPHHRPGRSCGNPQQLAGKHRTALPGV